MRGLIPLIDWLPLAAVFLAFGWGITAAIETVNSTCGAC